MQPFEIVKKTPQTNCRECGYPACLAFAVAVSKSGEDPGKCPYIEKMAVHINHPGGNDPSRDRDLALIRHLKNKIAPLDFKTTAQRLGATWSENYSDLEFSYLNDQVRLTKESLQLNETFPEDTRDQILLYNYICSPADRQLTGNWVGLESFPNSISKVKTLKVYCEDRLAKLFDEKSKHAVVAALQDLGCTLLQNTSAALAAVCPVLPCVPQQIHFWQAEPEDGFPSQVKLLFDSSAMAFLDLESLVFSSERLADKLAVILEAEESVFDETVKFE